MKKKQNEMTEISTKNGKQKFGDWKDLVAAIIAIIIVWLLAFLFYGGLIVAIIYLIKWAFF